MIKPPGCKPCSLYNISTSFTKPEGEGHSGVLLIGEAAGHEEAIDGLPFRPRAQAGSLLEKVIKEELGLSRDWFKILNIIQCQPPNNKLVNEWYEATAISCCGQYRDKIIQDFQPPAGKQKVIVALGATAFRTLTGEGYSLTEDDIVGHLFYYKGKKIQNPLYKDNIFDNEEFVFEENVKIPVIPTYHPSFVKRGNHHLTQLLAEHIKRAVNIAKGDWLSPEEYNKKKNYRIVGFDAAESFYYKVKDSPRLILSDDIETNESKGVAEDKRDELADTEITQVQFALDKYNAVIFPNFQGFYFSTAKKILELPNIKANHNRYNFDDPRYKAKGIKIDYKRVLDTMWCLRGDTNIRLVDGTSKSIKEIVDNKLHCEIWGMDEFDRLIPVKVVQWYKQRDKTVQWLKIKTALKSLGIFTPEHRIWTKKGWIESKDLQVGDYIKSHLSGADDFIQGSILGDGTITKDGFLSIVHSTKQSEYIEAKCEYLNIISRLGGDKKRGYVWKYCNQKVDDSYITKYYDKDRNKIFHAPVSPRSLAIWYMDDWGWYRPHPNHKPGYIIGVICFSNSQECCKWLEEKFGKENVKCEFLYCSEKGTEKYRIQIKKEGMNKFFDEIEEYVHPSMQYKLPEHRRNKYNCWLSGPEPQWVKIISIQKAGAKSGYNIDRYCIGVNHPTHRFFTNVGLVANCFKTWSPKLPRGLQIVAGLAGFPFAWKHLFSTDPEEYGGADVCSIHFILEWLVPLMKAMKQEFDTGFGTKHVVSVWDCYKKHVWEFHEHLQNASDDGIPVSEERRLDLDKELEIRQKEVDKEIQRLIPDEIRNIEPFKKIEGRDEKLGIPWERYDYGFVRTPTKQIEEAKIRYENAIAKIQEAGRNGSKNVVSFYQFLRKSYNLCQLEVEGFDRKTGESKGKVTRWVRILPFKASFDQMSNYINWKGEQLSKSEDKKDRALAKFYKVPKDAKGKETTAKGEIELLYDKTGDELLQLNLEARSLVTNRRNYIPNWKPNQFTGAVHTKWSFSPPQGQLVSYRPNVLNLSHHTQVGQLFRRIVEAPEGWEFGEFDKKSFHVGMMGYKANDANYIRFSQLDPHSIYCSYITPKDWGIKPITMDMSDGEILEVCKWIKNRCKQEEEKIGKPWANMRQAQAKPTVLGNQLELGYKKLYWQNQRSITSEARAKELQGILGEFSQKVVQAKVDIKWLAYRTGRLMNEFGRIQWFNDVIANTWNKSKNVWEKRFGDEAREAIAFAVQSPAFGMIHNEAKRIIPRLVELDLGYRPFRNSIHDSLVFIWQKVHRDRIVPIVLEEMRKPCRELTNQATGPEGLRIEVEYKLGRNLQNYDKIKNPEGMQEVKG